jgi:hypothetical protein
MQKAVPIQYHKKTHYKYQKAWKERQKVNRLAEQARLQQLVAAPVPNSSVLTTAIVIPSIIIQTTVESTQAGVTTYGH